MATTTSEDTSIKLDNGTIVPLFASNDPKSYLNKSIIMFGATESGKSKLIDHALYILKDEIPLAYAFAPADTANEELKCRIPTAFIYPKVSSEIIELIVKRQKMASEYYTIANNIDILRRVFERVATSTAKHMIKELELMADRAKEQVNITYEFAERDMCKKKIDIGKEKSIKEIMKMLIRTHRDRLFKTATDPEERLLIKYLDFNPRALLIFEDCGPHMSEISRDGAVLESFFYGRHLNLTVFYTFHDDTLLPALLRKNAHLIMFTTPESAVTYISRGSNGISGPIKQKAIKIAERIFDPPGAPNFKKLVYSRGAINPWSYTIAELHAPTAFKFGSPQYWAFSKEIKYVNPIRTDDKSNPFSKKFATKEK
jgi:energy-coupling factor transporter ATP-binding protein EcfA2